MISQRKKQRWAPLDIDSTKKNTKLQQRTRIRSINKEIRQGWTRNIPVSKEYLNIKK
jgi:hypothetical protein